MQMIWTLFCIIAVLYGTFLFSKFVSKRAGVRNNGKIMQVREVMPLNKDNSVYLIKIGDENFAMNVSSKGGASLLAKIELQEQENVPENNTINFSEFLKKKIEIKKKPDAIDGLLNRVENKKEYLRTAARG